MYAREDLPPLFRNHFVSKDGEWIAVFAYPSGDIWENKVAERCCHQIYSLNPEASGLALEILPNETMVVEGFLRAAVIAAILIALTLFAVFRNFTDTVLSAVPVLLGWCWMLGAMKPPGLTFNMANLVALPLLLGIGVNAGQYIVHRFRQSRTGGGGNAQLRDLVQGTGAATIVASLATMVGFASLAAADYRAIKSMGLLLTAGIDLTLTATIFVLPALLVLLKRAKYPLSYRQDSRTGAN